MKETSQQYMSISKYFLFDDVIFSSFHFLYSMFFMCWENVPVKFRKIKEFLKNLLDKHETHNEFIIVDLDEYRFFEYFREIKKCFLIIAFMMFEQWFWSKIIVMSRKLTKKKKWDDKAKSKRNFILRSHSFFSQETKFKKLNLRCQALSSRDCERVTLVLC